MPQADREQPDRVTALAMLGFAFAMAAFKFVQGVATLAHLSRAWDRRSRPPSGTGSSVLPVNFFRQYPAGDLADRADGVEEIQELMSGAGVAGDSRLDRAGLFYVGQMFGYDLHAGAGRGRPDGHLRHRQHDVQLPAAALSAAGDARSAARSPAWC